MAVQAHKRQLLSELRQLQLPLTLADHPICDYNRDQLRDLIALFVPGAADIPHRNKFEQCLRLLREKSTLDRGETLAAQLILTGGTLESARAFLLQSPPTHTPAAESVNNHTRESPGPDIDTPASPPQTPVRQCTSCLDNVPSSSFPSIASDVGCQHTDSSLCRSCLTEYIAAQSQSFVLETLPCPEAGCSSMLSYYMMQENAPVMLFERYRDTLNSRAITNASDYVDCSNAACISGGIVDDQTMTFMVCNECNTSTCVSCRTPWHPTVSHSSNLAAIRAGRVDAVRQERRTNSWLKRRTKPCPACGMAIIKNKGCDHMTW